MWPASASDAWVQYAAMMSSVINVPELCVLYPDRRKPPLATDRPHKRRSTENWVYHMVTNQPLWNVGYIARFEGVCASLGSDGEFEGNGLLGSMALELKAKA